MKKTNDELLRVLYLPLDNRSDQFEQMEKQQRTSTTISTSSSPQEAIASLDPLLQPIDDPNDNAIYYHRRSSLFYVPIKVINQNDAENIDSNKQYHWLTRCCRYLERFSGISYALIASFLFTCSNFIIKQLDVVLLDVFLIRFVIQGFLSFGYILYKGYPPFYSNSNGVLLFLRSLIAAIGSVCFYRGLSLLPLPDIITLRYTQVVWTAILVLIIFRERINVSIIIASLLTLIGVACVAQPSFLFTQSKIFNETSQTSSANNEQRLLGMSTAMLCAFAISMSIVLSKKLLERKVRQSIIMFHFILITTLMLFIIQTHYWFFSKTNHRKFNIRTICLTKNFICATILATLQMIPMVLTENAIKREHPSIVTVVQASDIFFALILQNIFLKNKSNGLALIGSTLVLTSIFIVGGHKLWLDRRNRTPLPTLIQDDK